MLTGLEKWVINPFTEDLVQFPALTCSSQPSAIAASRDSILLLASTGIRHTAGTQKYMQENTHTHKIIK